MTLKMGCAIWAFKGWVGTLFPPGSSPSQYLQLYSQRFPTVECNATFYSTPSPDVVKRWAQVTPPTFEFCPKLPRSITHAGPLQPKISDAVSFIQLMEGLGSERLGPIFIQLPPSYGPQAFQDLEAFLKSLQGGSADLSADLALEVRHPQWFQSFHSQRLNQLLSDLNLGRVLLDSRPIYECPDDPQLNSERRKPQLPLQPTVTADFGFIRYISHPDQDFNQSFMLSWIPHIERWLHQGKRLYLFIHCPREEQSPQNAQLFQHLLETHLSIPIAPLPWTQVPPASTQLSLF